MMLNFNVTMVPDALATYTDEEHGATLRTLLFDLRRRADHRRGDRLAQARGRAQAAA